MSPIRPENRDRYPKNWRQISLRIKERAGWRCECSGECGLHGEHGCSRYHGEVMQGRTRPVVLTVAHLDHQPENCQEDNLKALCEGCHNRYDLPTRIANRRAREAGTEPLFVLEEA